MTRKNRNKEKSEISGLTYIISSFIFPFFVFGSLLYGTNSIIVNDLGIFWDFWIIFDIRYYLPFVSLILALFTLRSKSIMGIFVNACTPAFIVLALFVAQYSMKLFIITFSVIAFLIVMYIIIASYFTIQERENPFKVIRIGFRNIEYIIFSVSMLVILPSYIYFLDAQDARYQDEKDYVTAKIEEFDKTRELSELEYDAKFENFSDEKWNKLSFEERLSLLDHLLQLECRNNKLPPIELRAAKINLSDKVQGEYDDIKDVIYISSNHLANNPSKECAKTILHEFRHYYQKQTYIVIRQMNEKGIDYSNTSYFDDAAKWLDAHDNYSNIGGYDSYYSNELEADSREYAEKEFEKYIKYFDNK